MSYNNPKPAKTQRTVGRPKSGRVKWNLKFDPAIRAGIERVAKRRKQSASDFLNEHFAYLAEESEAEQ